MSIVKTSITGVISFFLLIPFLYPQTQYVYPATENYHFRHLTTDDGLPVNMCYSVLKDPHGFIWIATRGGLCRYDGYTMKVYLYNPMDSTSISGNSLSGTQSMVLDHRENLWISTFKGLNRFDANTETFKRYQHNPEDTGSINSDWINCLFVDKTGTLWVGTGNKGGLNRYLPEKDQFISYSTNAGNPGWRIPGILSIYEDYAGIFWVGTANGLYQFDRKKETFSLIQYTPKVTDPGNLVRFKYIAQDIDSTLFFGTQFGYLTYDKQNNRLIPFDLLYDEHENFDYLGILPDFIDRNTLWMAGWWLYKFNRQQHSLDQVPYDPVGSNGINGELVNSIFFDGSNMLWVASERGITIMDLYPNQIETHPEFSKNHYRSNSFMEDKQGNLWIGTHDLVCIDKDMNLVREYRLPDSKEFGFPTKIVISLLEDAENNIWIGTEINGLYLLASGRDEIVRCTFPGSNPQAIVDIIEDSQGNVWFATDKGLFQRKTGIDPLNVFYQDSSWGLLSYSYILHLCEDQGKNLWIGTNTYGLFCQAEEHRSSNTFLHYMHDPFDTASLSSNAVWAVYEDCFHNLWVATEYGLNKFIPGKSQFKRYYNTSDLGSNFIYNLTGDDNGNLWMVTESGLIRYARTISNKSKKTTSQYTQFLQFGDIFPYKIFKSKTGKLFVGAALASGKGFYSFSPDKIMDNTHMPPIVINDFRIRNQSMKLDTNVTLKKHIVLNYNQNYFTFETATLDYLDPSKNQYAYYLEGLEEDWNYAGNNRFANYTDVPPGDYIFHVKGSNNDDYWNETGTSLAITILPPPWKTWWAYMLYGILLIGTAYLIIRFYLKRLQLSQRLELEQMEANKLKELDHLKSRFFANISHEFRTPLTLILGPLEKFRLKISDKEGTKDLNIMQRNALRLQNLINQLLNLSKLESGHMKLHAMEVDLIKLVNGYVMSFESLANQRKINLIFKAEEKDIRVYVDQEKLEKILYNLLSNAFKFTAEKGRITVEVISHQSRINIIVSDTGPGIPPEKLPHIFDRFYQADDSFTREQEGTGIGLALTKELVELHHGNITVESEVNKETNFTVNLPLGIEHLNKEEIIVRKDSYGDQDEASKFGHHLPAGKAGMPNVEYLEMGDDPSVTSNEQQSTIIEQPVILIVEDNSDLREYICDSLGQQYQILEAQDGEEGQKRAIEKVPDLIISDVMMPKMDGFELCKKLKTDERTSHIPVILLTARAGMESKIEGLETGADDYITKPFDARELLVRINNLLELRHKLRERFLKDAEQIGLSALIDLPETDISSMEQKFLQKAIGIVNANLSDPEFTVKRFCAEMAMSNMQLHRKLVAVTGQTANKFLRSYRLNHAAKLLEKRTGNVTEIAYEVGFNNLSWFAKCFQEQFSMSPSEYHTKKT